MSVNSLFPSPPWPALPVTGENATYPLHRIFCVGRNYAAHAAEMGNQIDREAPIYFTKSALSYLPTGMTSPYPPGTENYHYEVELVVAIGAPLFRATPAESALGIFGYGLGLDMTRRDLQARATERRQPWDLAKDVEESAVLAPLTRAQDITDLDLKAIQLALNGEIRQDGKLSDMVWSIPELISRLSEFYHLAPGDVILTGTPAGIGPVHPGDHLIGTVDGLTPVTLTIGPAQT